jgi:hypothetical protein
MNSRQQLQNWLVPSIWGFEKAAFDNLLGSDIVKPISVVDITF